MHEAGEVARVADEGVGDAERGPGSGARQVHRQRQRKVDTNLPKSRIERAVGRTAGWVVSSPFSFFGGGERGGGGVGGRGEKVRAQEFENRTGWESGVVSDVAWSHL